MDQKTRQLVSAYIDIQAETEKNAKDIMKDIAQCGISRQDLVDNSVATGQISFKNLSALAARYARACSQAGYEQEDITDAFARMGFTRAELKRFGLSMYLSLIHI